MDENNNQEMQETLRQLKEGFDSLTSTLTGVTDSLKKSAEQTAKANERQEKADVERFGYTKDENGKLKTLADQRNEVEAQYAAQVKKSLGEEAGNAKLRGDLIAKELGELAKLVDANGKLNDTAIRLRAEQTSSAELLKKQIQLQLELQKLDVDSQNLKKKEVQELIKKEADNKRQADKQKKSLDDFTKMIESPGSAFNDLAKKNQSLGDITNNAKDGLLKMHEGSLLATTGIMAVTATFSALGSVATGLVSGFMAMNNAIWDGERGQKVAAKGVTALADEYDKAAKTFGGMIVQVGAATVAFGLLGGPIGLVGMALGGLAVLLGTLVKSSGDAAKELAKLNERAAQLNDDLFAGFQELGRASMTGARGMDELKDNLHAANMTVKDFEKFKGILQSAGKDMKMFGITAAEGVKTFAETTGSLVKSSLGRTFELMGISQAEQAAHAERYMAQQTRFGLMQGKTVSDLAKGAGKYIEELDKLATLTGATRQEQEEARNAVMAIEELRAAMIDAERQGDTARLEELKRAADMAEQLQAAGLSRQATGTAQYFAAGNAITSQESAEAAQTLAGTFEKIQKNLGTAAERTVGAAKEVYEQAGKYASVRKIGGTTEGLYGDSYGKTADFYKRVSPEAIAAEREKAEKAGKKFDLDAFLLEQRKATDKKTTEQIDLTREQQQYAIKLDNVADEFGKATNINKKAADAFKAAVDTFEKILNGEKGKTATGPSEVAKAEEKATKTMAEAQKVIADPNASKQDKLKAAQAAFVARKNASELASGERLGAPPPVTTKEAQTNRSAAAATDPRRVDAKKISQSDLVDMGLRIKKGDVHGENNEIDPRLLDLAHNVQSSLPNFAYFSGFNDKYHQERASSSSHTKGLAMDFVLTSKPTPEEGKEIVDWLLANGASQAIDEYNNPSSKSTAGHIHAQLKAMHGGMFDGPPSGYQVELHNREAVVSLPNPGDKIMKVDENEVKKSPIDTAMISPSDIGAKAPIQDSRILEDMYAMMEEKMSELINKIIDSNDIQDRILKNSMT